MVICFVTVKAQSIGIGWAILQYCKSIGICMAILIKNLYWYWYWQYFFQAVLVLVLPILCKSIVNNPGYS